MKFLLDTDHSSVLERAAGAEYAKLTALMAQHPHGDFAFSIVSFHEHILGANTYIGRARSTSDELHGYALMANILRTHQQAAVLPFDAAAAAAFDGLRAQKIRIGTMDLRIAAIALSNGLTLLTRNATDFAKVPGLTFKVWTA